jgi:O-6-methylguanine DNA methyltransferase
VHKESEKEFRERNNLDERPIIGLLAGSRVMEINYLLPRMVKLEKNFPDYQFLLAGAPSIDNSIYDKHLKSSNIKLLTGETYGILKHSKATVLSSGTASLEAALLDAPQVVCYGGNEISYRIAKLLVKVKFISLVNLILDRPVVKELIQHDCTPDNITKELKKLLSKGQREKLVKKYSKLRDILGGEGASVKVAKSMIEEYNKMVDSRRFSKIIDTPIGLLRLTCDKDSLTEVTYLQSKNNNLHNDIHPVLTEAEKQFKDYFANQRKSFDLPIKPDGTEFQRKVWEELCRIPYGKVRSYGEVAKLIGTKDANRAVGMACKMNPLLIVVPCHRVLGAHNKLTGFNIGIDKKSFLLEHEKAYQSEEQNLFN